MDSAHCRRRLAARQRTDLGRPGAGPAFARGGEAPMPRADVAKRDEDRAALRGGTGFAGSVATPWGVGRTVCGLRAHWLRRSLPTQVPARRNDAIGVT